MEDKQYLDKLRHSCAHLLAAAVVDLYPNAHLTIGPPIENGFYYDIEFKKPVTEEDLPKIEKKMKEILESWNGFEKKEMTAREAKEYYKSNPYKKELIEEIEKKKEPITFYKNGDFEDLCRGGHVNNAKKEIGAFKLLSLAGAYWRGSEKNKMLTRIYGTCFSTKEELDKYLWQLEEAKKRDHKKLGRELEIFMFHETAPGMPYWLPKGVIIYNELIKFWREEHVKRDYKEIVSPLLNKKELYVTSGHYEHYWQNMFVCKTSEGEEYGVKAMNCPNAHVVFDSKPRSYKELPLRLGDTDTLHRHELSGTLNGLLRVREFRQDDAHIYIAEDQIESEYQEVFKIVEKFYQIFNIEYSYRLGTRPDSFMGDIETWDLAEISLRRILEKSKKIYTIAEKDGAFYGPKVDILMKDALGREWQMGTIQLDFQQPRRFKLKYIDHNGQEKTPVVIHRVVYGSLERFIGILIEHTAGNFPLWLSPVQVKILPISDKQASFAIKVNKELQNNGIRAEMDLESKTVGYKIRQSTLQKVPYMVIIGEKEVESKKSVSVRTREGKDLGMMELDKFISILKEKIEKRQFSAK